MSLHRLSSASSDSQRIVRELFSLPTEATFTQEDILDDFSCALKRKASMHGRLFCTDHNLCFYANMMGFKTKQVIAFESILKIEKPAKSKSIHIFCAKDKHYVFTSFVSSTQAFKFMKDMWKASGYAPDTDVLDDASDGETTNVTEEKEEGAVPLPDDQGSMLEIVKMIIALSPFQFFTQFLSDTAQFPLSDHWRAEGGLDASLGVWNLDDEVGAYTREGKYRVMTQGVVRIQSTQMYKISPDSLLFRSSSKQLDGPGARTFQIEHEWTLRQITKGKSIFRINSTIKFLQTTSKKQQIEAKMFPELRKDAEQWVVRAQSKKLLPDPAAEQEKIPEPKVHQLTTYEEVDLESFTKARQVEKIAESSTLLYVNVFGLFLAGVYLVYLHYRLSGHFRDLPCL